VESLKAPPVPPAEPAPPPAAPPAAPNKPSLWLGNSKSKYRNPKQIQMIKFPKLILLSDQSLEFWSFEFVSNLGFRASNLIF